MFFPETIEYISKGFHANDPCVGPDKLYQLP